ncbi:MAG: hypothetical protein RLZZ01_714, partial [Actinomycetota bacterium]
MRSAWTTRTIVSTLVVSLVAAACSGGGESTDPTSSSTPAGTGSPGPVVNVAGRQPEGFSPVGLRLSEGEPSAVDPEPVTVVGGTPLSPQQIAAVLDRLPEWEVPVDDRQVISLPPQTLLPPLVGDTVDTEFPPADDSTAPSTGDSTLEVLRIQPEGPVELAPFVTVTFDQPMVPLTTLDQLEAIDIPVEMTPSVEGRWRWIGTRTLRFELVPGELDRLPGSTDYTIEIPAGTRAANGARLQETVTGTFTTPTVDVVELVGEGRSLPLDPVFVAVFDQIVDPTAVLSTIELRAGGERMSIRLANASEVDADPAARAAVDRALAGRAVAFRAVGDLPPDAGVFVKIGPATPSAEGPNTAVTAATFDARTFGALDIVRSECGWGEGCAPGDAFSIEFSNVLDPNAFDADQIRVEPAIAGLRIDVYGPVVSISGATVGRTDYTVTLDADLRDEFGQTLGAERTVSFEVGSAPPQLRGFGQLWVTTDPAAEAATVTVSTINHDAVAVRAWAVDPTDLED